MSTPETQYVSVGDADIAYQVIGDGPIDLVFHHGMCHVDLQWDVRPEAEFLRALAGFSRLILFDRRGTGASERGSSPALPTWEEWGEDLRAVLDEVGSEQLAIFGEAEGAATAILFAATHPDRVNALILGNASARPTVADDYPIGLAGDVPDWWASLYESVWGKPDSVLLAFPSLIDDADTVRAVCKLMRAAASPRAAARLVRHVLADLDVRQALSAVHIPTLVLRSNWPPPALETVQPFGGEHTAFVAEHIANAKLVDVPIDDYLYFGGDFRPVVEEVSEFLTGVRPTRPVDRILTTVLFTDIADSTRMAARAGDERWRGLLDRHDLLIRDQLQTFSGREVKTTGDGFLAAFDGPGRAVRCAQAIAAEAAGLGLTIRAGLHTGECEVREDDDLAGLAVHIAARVSALAMPGEVLVSSTVKDLVAGSGIEFTDHGEHELKGVPERWKLYAVRS
jgi:class 3 adenylate cyclase